MKKLGLVGGIGPASTVEYYKAITSKVQAALGGENFPPLVIDSLNLQEVYDLVEAKQWEAFAEVFILSVQRLVKAGAELGALGANTAHIVFDEVQQASQIPLISIVDTTRKHAQSKGYKKVLLFGTAFTMSHPHYPKALASCGIETILPDARQQNQIHQIIFPNLQAGIVCPEQKKAILALAEELIRSTQAEALILACTELPLIIKPEDLDIPVIDTTQVHIEAIVNEILR